MSLPLRVSGDLRDVDPALLVRSLSRSRESGRLVVSEAELGRSLYFRSGEVVFASSNDPEDRLGAWLVRAGRLGLDELERFAPRVSPDLRFGAVLVEEGLLAPDDLVEAVTAQLVHIVHAVVRAERGRYWFDFSEIGLKELIVLRRDTRALVLGGLRGAASLERVRRGLQQLRGRRWIPVSPELRSAFELTGEEEQLLHRLEGGWDGGALPELPGRSAWECARTMWALQVCGALLPAGTRHPTPAPRAAGLPTPRAPLELGPLAAAPAERLEEAIRRFNLRQQEIHRVLRIEMGAAAEVFVRSALKRLPPEQAALFERTEFLPRGHFDAGRLLVALAERGEQALPILDQLIEEQLLGIGRMLGEDRAVLLRAALETRPEEPGTSAPAAAAEPAPPAGS